MGWCNRPRCFVITCAATALVLIILSAVSYPLLDKFVHDEITKATMIKPGSQVWKVWKDGGGVPVYFEMYMYDLLNEDEVVNNGSKPNVTTRGPYTYNVYREKFNITFNKNGTVTYRENTTYFFDPEKSVGPDNENITTLSIPVITLLSYLPFKIPLLKFLLEIAKEDIFITKTVKEIVFGYDDQLLIDAHKFFPDLVTSTKVGVLYGKNFTDDGLYTVFTGEKDIHKVGLIDKWNGVSLLDTWSTKYANMINGTDGTLAPPFVIDEKFVTHMYATDICRSVYATYETKVDHYGVQLYRYGAPEIEFLNATLNPDNGGFCVNGHCFDSGVIDASKCNTMAGLQLPIIVSNPHFLYGAKQYVDAIIGINPNQPNLNTALEIEPKTGLILKASKRLQINLNVNNTKQARNVLNKIPTMIYPLLWVNETATSGKDDTDKLKSQLDMTSYAHIAQIVLFAIAGVLLLASIVVCALYKETRRGKEEAEPFLNDQEEPEHNDPINDNENE